MPMQIPEEIIHAAGALPVVIPEGEGLLPSLQNTFSIFSAVMPGA